MKMTLRGVVHGKTIELAHEPGLPEGQEVEVVIETTPAPAGAPPWWLERIVVDPAVRPAKSIVKGTRLEANMLATLLEEGRTEDELLRAYPELTGEDVAALREYAKVPRGLRQAFGAWADEAEGVDRFIEETYRLRGAPHRGLDE